MSFDVGDRVVRSEERGLGLIFDDPAGDARDWQLPGLPFGDTSEPTEFVTRNRDTFRPKPLNQRGTNYCANFATVMSLMHAEQRVTGSHVPLSPLFNGFYCRSRSERVGNSGTMIRSAFDGARRYGVPAWDAHPLELVEDDYLSRLDVSPDYDAAVEAMRHQGHSAYRVPDRDWAAIHGAVRRGYGVVIGIPWLQGYEEAGNGKTPLPPPYKAGALLGYHAVYVLDFDVVDGVQVASFINSWGTGYGDEGYGLLRLETLQQSQDNWVSRAVETVRRVP